MAGVASFASCPEAMAGGPQHQKSCKASYGYLLEIVDKVLYFQKHKNIKVLIMYIYSKSAHICFN
jgi:hypothetical protein